MTVVRRRMPFMSTALWNINSKNIKNKVHPTFRVIDRKKLFVLQDFDCPTTFFHCFLNNETIFSLALSGEKQFVSL